MRKTIFRRGFLLLTAVTLVAALFGCSSVGTGQDLVKQGKIKEAIIYLANSIADNDGDWKAVEELSRHYPSYANGLNTRTAEILAKQGDDRYFNDKLVLLYEELLEIQNAIRPISGRLVGKEKKFSTTFSADPRDIGSLLSDAKEGAAAVHYADAKAMLPGQSMEEKRKIVDEFLVVLKYVENYKDSHDHIAGLSYEIAGEMAQAGDVETLKGAIKWYELALAYVAGFRDSRQQVQTISFDVAEYYKGLGDQASYDIAYGFYQKAGDFKTAPREVALYQLGQAINRTDSSAKSESGNYSLSTTGSVSEVTIKETDKGREANDPLRKKVALSSEASDMNIFNPKSDVIYIGSLIDGQSIADGTYRPIPGARSPLTVSIDLGNINGDASVVIPDPSRASSVQNSVNRLVSQGTSGSMAARAKFRYQEVKSSTHFQMGLGIGYGKANVQLESQTDYSTFSEKSSTLVELTQVYYNISMDLPQKPSDLFSINGQLPSPESWTTTPYYVSTVTYGRRAYFLIESTATTEEIQQTLGVAMKSVAGDSETGIDVSVKNAWSNSKTSIKSFVLGGEARGANITSLEGILDWVKSGMDISDNLGAAVPIGYTMRSLKDNGIAMIVNSEESVVPARAEIVIRPYAIMCEQTPSVNPKAEVELMVSRKNLSNPRYPGGLKNDTADWAVLLNTNESPLGIGDGGIGQWFGIESYGKPFSRSVAAYNDTFTFAGNIGDAYEVNLLLKKVQKTDWARQSMETLTVSDIANQNDKYRMLTEAGWLIEGSGYRWRLRFQIELRPID